MKSSTKKLIAIILSLSLFGSYLIYQAVLASKEKIETQYALNETVYKTIDTEAFILRDESFVEKSATGTTVSFVKDGERVARNDTVSMVFDSEKGAETYMRINEIQTDIDRYEKLEMQANLDVVNVKTLDARINTGLEDFLKAVDTGKFAVAAQKADDFRDSVTAKQIAVGGTLDVSKELSALRDELSELQATSLTYSEVKSAEAGYYIGGADGYEDTLHYDDLDKLTADDVTKAIQSKPSAVSENVAGRIVPSFNWYMLCVVDTADTVNLTADKELFVNFPYAGIEKLPVKLYKVGDHSGDRTMVILSCDLMNDSLADLRIEQMEIVTRQYTGLKVPNSAIRTVDGIKGVYVVSGTILEFKKIHVVFSDENYTIVDNPDQASDFIRLYDKVVTKGVELYDYKLVRG